MEKFDAVIVGAGPAGLMTALTLAERGFRVAVLERRTRELAGRPVRVSLEKGVFQEVGLSPPLAPELMKPPQAREFISPDRNYMLKVKELPLLSVNLRALVRRLVELCEEKGVEFRFESKVAGALVEEGRVSGVVGTDRKGDLLELRARLAVDASGTHAALRHSLEPEMGVEQRINPRDLCDAWHESREINREIVMDLLAMNRIRPQVDVLRFGFMGPYSMFSVFVDLEEDRVEITAGVLNDPRFPSARELVEGYIESHRWVGERIAGGGGLIPVRRPLDSFVADGFACAGDAACQAMPQHASGVSSALRAGRLLGETAARALEQGEPTRESLWAYNRGYMETRGAVQANSELFRRFVSTLTTEEITFLFAKGLVSEEAIRGSLEGLALELPKSAILAAMPGILFKPSLARRMFRLSRDSGRALGLYQSYPGPEEIARFPAWQEKVQDLFASWIEPAAMDEEERERLEPTLE